MRHGSRRMGMRGYWKRPFSVRLLFFLDVHTSDINIIAGKQYKPGRPPATNTFGFPIFLTLMASLNIVLFVKCECSKYYTCSFHLCSCYNRKPSQTVKQVWYDNSTSNLNDHVRRCAGNREDSQCSIDKFASGGIYDKGALCLQTVFWVASCYHPYYIVNDKPFLNIISICNPSVKMVTNTTVSDDVLEVHRHMQPLVAKMLQGYPGFLHLSFHGWSSRNALSFLGITVHLVTTGKMVSFILDFIE